MRTRPTPRLHDRPGRDLAAALAAALLVALPAAAQEVVPDVPTGPERTLAARRAEEPILLDGLVTPGEWEGADVATDFLQYEPRRGEPATQPTEALLLFDDTTVYVAFRVPDEAPPTAQLTRRDADVMQDDSVVVVLDTFLDRQTAYLFGVNALGTQADGRVVGDGRTIETTWDGTWSVAVARDGNDWSAEFAIPLSTLQYRSGTDVSWGVNFMRTRTRNLEIDAWAGPLDAEFRISQAGTVTGLEIASSRDRLQVIPYGQGVLEQGEKSSWRGGGDVRYALTSSTLLNATVNPDFALVEADQEQVNLTRFELRLPEKRPFFLEGEELFQQRIRTFYSRRIEDITAGAKLLGKQGPWSTSAVYSRAVPAGSPEGSDDADFGVVRVGRDLGRSNVAFIGAARRFEGSTDGSTGLDATLFFTDSLGMTAQLVQSFGAAGDDLGGTLGGFIRPAYDTPTTHFHVRFTYLGEAFADNVNAVGFVRDDDRRELDSAFSKTFWLESGPFERIEYDSNYNVYWAARESTLRSWEVRQGVEVDLRNRLSFEVGWVEDMQLFEREFRNRAVEVEVGYNTRAFEQVSVGYEWGRNFGSDFTLWTMEAAYKVSDQLSAEYELERLTLDPDPEGESTWIHVLRASQFFTPDLFVRGFFQTNSAIDRRNVQLTFVYRYQPPFGTVQLAYQRGTAEFGERSEQGDTLFVKVTTVL